MFFQVTTTNSGYVVAENGALPGSVETTRSARFALDARDRVPILNPYGQRINFPIGCRFGFLNFNDER